MSEKDITRWNDTITPQERGKPWVLGAGGSWDLKEVQPIPDEMLSELAQRYHYAGTPWNCRSMPLTPSDREYMYLIYYSMQGLVARLRIAEQKLAESVAAPSVAIAAKGDELPPLPDVPSDGAMGYSSSSTGGSKTVRQHYSAHQMREYAETYASAAVLAERVACAKLCDFQATWAKGEAEDQNNSDKYRNDNCERQVTAELCADAIRARN